jgi:hypothetical protein
MGDRNGPLQFRNPVRALRAVIGTFRMPCHNISLVNQLSQHGVHLTYAQNYIIAILLYVYIQ